jgi:predicted TIM-barrel fold metal-dependent hydrolase
LEDIRAETPVFAGWCRKRAGDTRPEPGSSARAALVQGSAHGRDNSAMLDALANHPQRLRGVAVADQNVPPEELRRWHGLGIRGLRFNHFFQGGQLHYRGGVPLEAARALAPVMRELGWHLQLWIPTS